jgi:hypothetical protein
MAMTTLREKPACLTIARLKNIKRGERIVYYVGPNLEAAMADPKIPLSAHLLQRIKETAQRLETDGYAELLVENVKIKVRDSFHLVESKRYVAIGI